MPRRMAFNAGSEVGRDSMLLDEDHEFVPGRGMDVIGVLSRLIVEG
jgi:hypothetical protein